MDCDEITIFLTDKNGKNDKTSDIESISMSDSGKIYNVKFFNNEKIFHYKTENVQIVKNCLGDKSIAGIFDYLLQMAQFSKLENDSGEKLLVQNLRKSRFINKDAVLACYFNPKKNKPTKQKVSSLIFPFGCNNSQFRAVETALSNQISIIQGPPGTGKTQTILNIIANLLMDDKTVLVVSNNNDAIENIYEKFASEKYKMDFICAKLGKYENIKSFIENQEQKLPEYLESWYVREELSLAGLNEKILDLKKLFCNQEKISELNAQMSSLDTEIKHFRESSTQEQYSVRKKNLISSVILKHLQKYLLKYNEKEKISFFSKWYLKIQYGIKDEYFWNIDEERLLYTLKSLYYKYKFKEITDELQQLSQKTKSINSNLIYHESLLYLKNKLAGRFLKKQTRSFFSNIRQIKEKPQNFVNEYPVILSSTFSSRNLVEGDKGFLFDYVIMDEASQVDIVTGALALSCAKNAVIVGDKMQLPNVIQEKDKNDVLKIFEESKLPEGYNFINSFLVSVEKILPNTPQTLLREHYRCHPKIINFCNQQFYGGKLLVMTNDSGEQDVMQVIKTVPGDFCKNRCNQRQIDVIKEEIILKYSESEKENTGIIAPYRNQVEQIMSQIPNVETATVHKFQGREKDNIIISTVDNKITCFSDDPHMLNVAISRAKRKLIVIMSGNEQPENSNISALIKYIQYNNFRLSESSINSIFDFLYTKMSESKFNYLTESKKISKYATENAMNSLLTQVLSEEKYSRFKFVFEMPLKDIINKNFINKLPEDLLEFANRSWSHVDFIVYNVVTKEILFGIEVDGYNYHKKGTKQAIRDAKKNKIFEIIGLPLLRFNTRNSGEEERIRKQLEQYVIQ